MLCLSTDLSHPMYPKLAKIQNSVFTVLAEKIKYKLKDVQFVCPMDTKTPLYTRVRLSGAPVNEIPLGLICYPAVLFKQHTCYPLQMAG